MKFFLAASLLSLNVEGFTLPSRTAPLRAVKQKAGTYHTRLLEQPELLSEDVLMLGESSAPPSPAEAVDLGKEIFLNNLQKNAKLASTGIFGGMTNDFQTVQGTKDVAASVSAVLAASEEAVAAAEASLPACVADTLMSPNSSTSKIAVPEPVDLTLSPSLVVGGAVTKKQIVAPPVSKILRFAIPAVGVWLCGPLLSLIDTAAVGLLSGTAQQAALNPAVAVSDYAALLIAFLYTGTTNLIAAARETDRGTEEMPRTAKTFVGAMQLATYVGAGLGLLLFSFAPVLLRAIIGNDSISPAVFDAAMKYVRIRAIGMPAAAVIGSAQAACLGMQDIRSPLYVLGVAAAVNFMGDMLLVAHPNTWIGGAAGAAWATVFSQYAAVAIFVRWLSSKPKLIKDDKKPRVNLSQAILELTGKPKSAGSSRRKRFRAALRSFRNPISTTETRKEVEAIRGGGSIAIQLPKVVRKVTPQKERKDEDNFTVRGFLFKRFRGRDLFKFPNREAVKEVGAYLVPVTVQQVGRVSGYVAMSYVVSSSLGMISMAAQQVIVSLFYCLCPVADSLSLTAQSFVPSIHESKPSAERTKALKQTAVNFAKAGSIFGVVMAAAASCTPLLSGFFTSDLYVASLVNMVAPLLMVFFSMHGVMCAMEGVMLGRKDLNFLGTMYAGFFFVLPYLLLRVKRAALCGTNCVNLTSVWKIFVGYQLFRSLTWSARVALLQRRTHRESEALGERP